MLKLQSKYVTDKKALELLKESRNRIQSMSLIHQKLYQIGDISHINFQDYITTVVMHLQHSFGILEDRVKVKINADGIVMSLDNAIPVGLIVNELVSNSLKYAFPNGKKGEININAVYDENEGNYLLIIRDNGVGLKKEINLSNTDTFGLNLVNLLVGQLGGTLDVLQTYGLEFRINFKGSDYTKRA
jgi:two-component sensor histidine kinase